MRFIVFVKANHDTEAGIMPSEELLAAMTKYNEELVKAGIMLAGEGLHPSSRGARIQFSGDRRTVVNGPFAETKELVAGFWMWQCKSLQDAIDWAKRCPNPTGAESVLEIRQVFSPEDFGPAYTPELQQREQQMTKEIEKTALETPRIEIGRDFLIAGLNGSFDMQTRNQIPALWQRFAPHIGKVPGQVGKDAYGVCWNMQPGHKFDYLAGVEINSDATLPKDFTSVRIPGGNYLVFTHRKHISTFPDTVDAIWTRYLPNSQYKPANTPNFERYTPAWDPKTGTGPIEIWIPLKS